MSGAALRLINVAFSYGETAMAFDLDVAPSSIVAVMGPSGSGKSTLLNLIAGFETPSSGAILIGGEDVTRMPPAARPVSMVFQENNLFAHLSVEQNVGLGRSPALRLAAGDRADIAAALARTGLSGKEKRLPAELSGGERQRVALSRVLVRDRPVLLLDEPFAALGPALRDEMLELLSDVQGERGMTVLLVSHQPEDAWRIADRVIFLEDGKVSETGAAQEFFEGGGSEAFRRYTGGTRLDRSRRFARKRT